MNKRRFTHLAVAAIAVDLLVAAAAWQVAPAMSLAASLAVPRLEPILAPLYEEPRTERPGDFHVYRAARPRAAVLLVRDADRPDAAVIALARALARRDLTVIVPGERATSESDGPMTAALAYARSTAAPLRISRLSSLLEDTPGSPYARAARAVHVYRIAASLLATP